MYICIYIEWMKTSISLVDCNCDGSMEKQIDDDDDVK